MSPTRGSKFKLGKPKALVINIKIPQNGAKIYSLNFFSFIKSQQPSKRYNNDKSIEAYSLA